MALKTFPFDPAEYLDDNEAIAEYLSDALETGEAEYIAHAIGVVARAKGMTLIARETGLARESLYRALSEEGNPSFATVVGVLKALGLNLQAAPSDVGSAKAIDMQGDVFPTTPTKQKGRARKSTARKIVAKKRTTTKKAAPKKRVSASKAAAKAKKSPARRTTLPAAR